MSPAMVAYFAHRLANPWWTPEADEAAQWVADWYDQREDSSGLELDGRMNR